MLDESEAAEAQSELAAVLLEHGYVEVIAAAHSERPLHPADDLSPQLRRLVDLIDAMDSTFRSARDLWPATLENLQAFDVSGIEFTDADGVEDAESALLRLGDAEQILVLIDRLRELAVSS
jgi:hypothetical protein